MRWRFGFLALALTACGQPPAMQLAARWGCGSVGGLAAISGDKAPAWVLVGELTETAEAPAALADIACNLATDERKLFVGVTDYVGGATDAEKAMLARLDAMIAKGAPIVVGHIGGNDHPYGVRQKSKLEKAWAVALANRVAEAGASRALLFVPRTDAIAEPIPPSGDRFAGYSPMPVFLNGGVVSLEVAHAPALGATGPEIRIYPAMQSGFSGQLVLASLTRPSLAVVLPMPIEPIPEIVDPEAIARRILELLPIEGPSGDKLDSPITDAEYQEIFDQLLKALPKTSPE